MTRSYIARNRRGGSSLIELVVASALILVVMVAVYDVVNKGFQYFRLNQSALDCQASCLSVIGTINSNVQNADSDLICCDTSGISYCEPFNNNGQVIFVVDPSTGVSRVQWQAYDAIYRTSDGIVRQSRKPMSPPSDTPSPPLLAGMSPSVFAAAPFGKQLATGITVLNITKVPKGTLIAGGGGNTTATDSYDYSIEAGNPNDPGGYWMRLVSSTSPRNN